MEVAAKKGTVTPLASLFTPEDAEKAARRVQETLAEKQADLDRVQGFISDNTSLMNLVQRLPNDLHHDIMVPFGKAAFFPGRLIHTNEFLVLLGEGYYAERTSKQTAEILYRRDQGLASQAESLKAIMHDLKAEASFFVDTASEAAEGLVEITEDYVEENSTERESQSGPPKEDAPRFSEADDTKVGVKDEEYARMMSRLDELEKEELEAEYGNGSNEVNAKVGDEDEDYARMMSRLDELEKEELEAECGNGRDDDNAKVAVDDEEYTRIISRLDELEKEEPEAEHDNETDEEEKIKADFDQLWNQRSLDNNLRYSEVPVQTSKPRLDSHKDFTGSIIERTHGLQTNSSQQTVTSSQVPVRTSKPGFDSHKAFPGSIIEHTNITGTNLSQQSATSSQSPSSQPSKPVSRFKMQRR